jgi:hypothetical protein
MLTWLLARLRYTKAALLVFGLGLIIGFVVVVGEFPEWERTAAAIMALGLLSLPITLFADGRGSAAFAWISARLRRSKRGKARARSRPVTRAKRPARSTRRAPRRKPG